MSQHGDLSMRLGSDASRMIAPAAGPFLEDGSFLGTTLLSTAITPNGSGGTHGT
jgi:hypothetical protein